MNRKLSLVLLIIFSLFLAALLSRSAALAWMSFPFLAYLIAGLLASPHKVYLRASRAINCIRCEAGSLITMRITIENNGSAPTYLRIDEQAQPRMRIIDGLAEQRITVPAGEKVELRYIFEAARGQYCWETVQATVSDSFGLFEKELTLAAAAEVRVLPGELPLNRLRLRPRQTLRAPGPNLSRLPGSGLDFFGVRQYHSGDSLRWIHWRLSARHPRLFFSKEFEREEMSDIGLILDGSSATNLQYGMKELFEYSVMATAALARNVLQVGNRVSLLILGERLVRVFPGTGKHQLVRILDQLAGCQPGENVSLNTLKYLPVRLFPSQSLIVIISPLRAGDFPTIARLRASGYQVLLVSPDPVQFARQEPLHPLALRAAELERQALLWRMREIGVQVIDWSVDQPLLKITGAFLWPQR